MNEFLQSEIIQSCTVHNVTSNVISLVLFSVVSHKKTGKKLISRVIKYKLGSSSKMQFVIFIVKTFKNFLENFRFCRKSGNDANSMGRGESRQSLSLRHYDACVRKSICDLPLSICFLNVLFLHSIKSIFFQGIEKKDNNKEVCKSFIVEDIL